MYIITLPNLQEGNNTFLFSGYITIRYKLECTVLESFFDHKLLIIVTINNNGLPRVCGAFCNNVPYRIRRTDGVNVLDETL